MTKPARSERLATLPMSPADLAARLTACAAPSRVSASRWSRVTAEHSSGLGSRNGADALPGPELVALAGAEAPLDSPLDLVASAEVMATGSEPRNVPQ